MDYVRSERENEIIEKGLIDAQKAVTIDAYWAKQIETSFQNELGSGVPSAMENQVEMVQDAFRERDLAPSIMEKHWAEINSKLQSEGFPPAPHAEQ